MPALTNRPSLHTAPLFIRKLNVLWRYVRKNVLRKLPPSEARQVRKAIEDDGQLSERYLLMCALSASIATIGLLQSSAAVVIGAMLVSPLMAPIAVLGLEFASLDGRRILNAARVVGIGSLIGILIGVLITLSSPIKAATPEILARTSPNLLDLFVALLSGLAGGYASVHRKGETAIGVAIATALMPPLATIGYSLAVLRLDYAMGSLLLFVTNLAAISFAFALVARIRNVSRPLKNVEFGPAHIAVGLGTFLLLAGPLAFTLHQLTEATRVSVVMRREIMAYFNIPESQIVSLSTDWPEWNRLRVTSSVVVSEYHDDAEAHLMAKLRPRSFTQPQLTVRQIVSADPSEQNRSLIETALHMRNSATPALSVPPIEQVRAQSQFPILSISSDVDTRLIIIGLAELPGVSLEEYRAEEARLSTLVAPWRVQVIPPYTESFHILFASGETQPDDETRQSLETAKWALSRWGVKAVRLQAFAPPRPRPSAEVIHDRYDAVATLFKGAVPDVVQPPQDSEPTRAEGREEGVDIIVDRPAKKNAAKNDRKPACLTGCAAKNPFKPDAHRLGCG